MTTRIDGNQGAQPAPQIDRIEADRASQARKPAPIAKVDRVEVSKDVDFVTHAVRAAHDIAAIREDKVAQAKKALADGTVGADAGKLADALIDHMLEDTPK
ncbi:MAG TPA: flagellar biosynthesis anti-sigma factor FlgM [Vicinamibacterales bacterium]|nr:flagellar biosynthesis anti-sigma factor FlgM [Vicinamibacterales bacterium]